MSTGELLNDAPSEVVDAPGRLGLACETSTQGGQLPGRRRVWR
jgi:hypothetical protein